MDKRDKEGRVLERYKFSDKEKKELLKSAKIIVDTREKKNEHIINELERIGREYIVKKLDYGDYSIMIPANESLHVPRPLFFDKEVMIERKASPEELSANFAQNRTRFKEEMAMAPAAKILLIEETNYGSIMDGSYDTDLNPASYIGSLHSFYWTYNLPFIFVDKDDSAAFIENYLVSYLKHIIR